jgi:hypothetical protein
VYLHGEDLLLSVIDENVLTAIPTNYTVLRVHIGTLAVNNLTLRVVVASLTAYDGGSASVPFPAGPQDLAIDTGLRQEVEDASGRTLDASANVTLFDGTPQSLSVAAAPTSRPAFLPDTWAWVRAEFMVGLSPSEGGPAQAVLTPAPLDAGLAARLGLTPLQTVGAIGFTQASIAEARSVLLELGAVIAVIIGLLAYQSIGLEVHLRQEEIRILRSLGAPPSTVAVVYEGKAIGLALLGATLGSALGIVAAHGLVSFAPLLGFPNLIVLPLPLEPVGLAYALAIGAAAFGGAVPARRAVSLVRWAPGARPS